MKTKNYRGRPGENPVTTTVVRAPETAAWAAGDFTFSFARSDIGMSILVTGAPAAGQVVEIWQSNGTNYYLIASLNGTEAGKISILVLGAGEFTAVKAFGVNAGISIQS